MDKQTKLNELEERDPLLYVTEEMGNYLLGGGQRWSANNEARLLGSGCRCGQPGPEQRKLEMCVRVCGCAANSAERIHLVAISRRIAFGAMLSQSVCMLHAGRTQSVLCLPKKANETAEHRFAHNFRFKFWLFVRWRCSSGVMAARGCRCGPRRMFRE